MVVAKIEQI